MKDKYIALGIKEYLEVKNKRRFILLFSSKLQVKTLNDFADYVIKHLCEPNHVKLSKYDNKYFDKLKSFVLDCKIKNIYGNIDILVNGILKYYKKE